MNTHLLRDARAIKRPVDVDALSLHAYEDKFKRRGKSEKIQTTFKSLELSVVGSTEGASDRQRTRWDGSNAQMLCSIEVSFPALTQPHFSG